MLNKLDPHETPMRVLEISFICKQLALLVVRITNIGQQLCFDRLLYSFHGLYLTTYKCMC